MNVNGILDVVRRLAPEENQSERDNCGVQIRGAVEDVTRMGVCLDPAPALLADLLEGGAQFVLTHHPLYFEPFRLSEPGFRFEVARLFLGSGAWLYAAHTSLDTRQGGPASWLGGALGLREVRTMAPLPGQDPEGENAVGYGQVGLLPEEMGYETFARLLDEVLGIGVWRACGPRPERVRSVGYLPGSGSSEIPAAVRSGIDVYVTGDLRYHQAVEAPMHIIDVGHHVIEEEMTRLFALELGEALPGVEVTFLPSKDSFSYHLADRVGERG
ncbi:MAG: Nif3-like dinuclear metal center hexameric protein [Desulfovibrionaceae bacterium]